MDDACFCDYEPADVYNIQHRVARKRHRCDECGRFIEPRERYERVGMLYDHHWSAFHTCSHCEGLRDYVTEHVPCFCWLHGDMVDQALEELREYSRELPGMFMGGARFIVAARQIRQTQGR